MNSHIQSSQDIKKELGIVSEKYQQIQKEFKKFSHQYETEKNNNLKTISDLEGKLNTYEHSIVNNNFETENEEILRLRNDLIQNQKDKEIKIKELKTSHDNIFASVNGVLSKYKESLNDLESQITEKDKIIENLKKESINLKDTQDEEKSNINKKISEMNSQVQSFKDIKNELILMTEKYQQIQDEFKNKTNQFEAENNKNLKIISELKVKMNASENSIGKNNFETENEEILRLRNDLIQNENDKENKIKELTNSHENILASVKLVLSKYADTLNDLQDQISEKDKVIENLNK